jgi:hypothetical protein
MKIFSFTSLHFKNYFFYLIGFTFFISCNKTEDYDKLDLLRGKEWNLESRKSNGSEITDSCDLDDVLYFVSSTDFGYDWGTLSCAQEVLEVTPQGWKLEDDFTVIRLKYKFKGSNSRGTMVEYWEIVELSDTALILKDATAENNNLVPEVRTYR